MFWRMVEWFKKKIVFLINSYFLTAYIRVMKKPKLLKLGSLKKVVFLKKFVFWKKVVFLIKAIKAKHIVK